MCVCGKIFNAENDFGCSIKLSIWKNQSEQKTEKTQDDEQDKCRSQVTKFLPN